MVGKDNPPVADDQFLDLMTDLRSRSIFDVLETRQDEEDHTRVLARLLDPQQSDAVAEAVLAELLEEAGVSDSPMIHGVRRLETLSSLDTDSLPDDRLHPDADLNKIQFDVLVDTSEGLFDFELKTKDSLKKSQYRRQKRRLEAEIDPGYADEVSGTDAEELEDDLGLDWVKSDEWTFVHLYKGDDDQPSEAVANDSAYHSLHWKHVADAVEDEIGRLEPEDTQWATAWIDHLRDHLIDDVSFTPSTKLQCLYPSQADKLEISEEPLHLDRKRLFNEYQNWFVQEFPTTEDDDKYDDRTAWTDRVTSSFAKKTKIIRIREQSWPSGDDAVGIWFEVLAKDQRMVCEDCHGRKDTQNEYRTNEAHIEVTVRYRDSDPNVRDQFIDYFEDADGFPTSTADTGSDEFALTKAGFDEYDKRNSYHVYTDQIRIEQGARGVLEELKERTKTLIEEATPVIDEYFEEEL